jgi:hypothetical protein
MKYQDKLIIVAPLNFVGTKKRALSRIPLSAPVLKFPALHSLAPHYLSELRQRHELSKQCISHIGCRNAVNHACVIVVQANVANGGTRHFSFLFRIKASKPRVLMFFNNTAPLPKNRRHI